MESSTVKRALLPWVIGGLLLGLTQVAAVGLKDPLGVTTQFVVVEGALAHAVAPEATEAHELIGPEKRRTFGYGAMVDLGLIVGAALSAVAVGRWRVRREGPVWWQLNHGDGRAKRYITGFVGGALILFGARMAGGCTSGMMASGWAQLAVAAVPFTIGLFAAGMIAARLTYPRVPEIER